MGAGAMLRRNVARLRKEHGGPRDCPSPKRRHSGVRGFGVFDLCRVLCPSSLVGTTGRATGRRRGQFRMHRTLINCGRAVPQGPTVRIIYAMSFPVQMPPSARSRSTAILEGDRRRNCSTLGRVDPENHLQAALHLRGPRPYAKACLRQSSCSKCSVWRIRSWLN